MGHLKPADLLAYRAGKRTLFMAKQFAFQQAGRDGRTVELDEGPARARAQVVKSTCDKLLTCARFPTNKHGRTGGCDGLDLLEGSAQGRAPSNNFVEVVFAAGLLLQVRLLFCQLILQRLNLPKRRINLLKDEGVLNGHSDLIGNKLQETAVRRMVGGWLLGREHQRA